MTTPELPAFLYAAKSTEDKRGSIPTQLEDCRRLASHEGWQVAGEFQDEDKSAFHGNRGPGLDQAKREAAAAAKQHGKAFLVAQHSDRFARGAGNSPDAADHLVEVLIWATRNGVVLRTVGDDFLADPRVGLLMAAVMGQRNTEDSLRKSEATKTGMRREAERGRHLGPPPTGYERREGALAVTTERAIVERVFKEFVAGVSMTAIAKRLNEDGIKPRKAKLWRQATISAILRNPVFIGKVKYDGEVFNGAHDAIIGDELWEKARQLLDTRPSQGKGRPPKGPHLLRGGMLVCGECGEKMYPLRDLYECSGRFGGCTAGAVLRRDVDEAILSYFESDALDLLGTREAVHAARDSRLDEASQQRAGAEAEAARLAGQLVRIKGDYRRAAITADDWDAFRDEIESEREASEAEADRWRAQEAEVEADTKKIDAEQDTLERLASIRKAITGEVNNAEGVDAVRSALTRLFQSFVLHRDRECIEPKRRATFAYDLTPGNFRFERVSPERVPLEIAGNKSDEGSGCL